jgi:uncharacterized Zn-finger protein
VRAPTPHSRATESGARKARSSPGGTTRRPSGFAWSDPIFATNFTDATPADAGSRSSSRMRWRSPWAITAGSPKSARDPVTSRKASSSDSGSMRSVTDAKISCSRSLASTYAAKRGRTTTASRGASRSACAIGIALRTPYGRTS